MKKIIYILTILGVLILNTNCTSMQYNSKTLAEMEAKKKADQEEHEKKLKAEVDLMLSVMIAGTPIDSFVKVWGEPRIIKTDKKDKFFYYDLWGSGYSVLFLNGKYYSCEKDEERTNFLAMQRKIEQLERQVRINTAQADYDRAMQNLNSSIGIANAYQTRQQLNQIQYNQLNQQQQPQPRIQGIPTR